MTYGPIDFIALEFKGNKFSGEIIPSLLELVEQGIVRVIDLVVVMKGKDSELTVLELQELDPNLMAVFDPLNVDISGMVTAQDIEWVGAALEDNSTAAVMLFENLWAVKFKEAVLNADGRVIAQERIPHEIVLEALSDLSALDEATA